MEKLPVSANIRRYTTQEVIQNQVKDLVHQLMDEVASRRNGWVMSDIVTEVNDAYGRTAVFARDYIVKDVCEFRHKKTPRKSKRTYSVVCKYQ